MIVSRISLVYIAGEHVVADVTIIHAVDAGAA
jgi:hypothetical protein